MSGHRLLTEVLHFYLNLDLGLGRAMERQALAFHSTAQLDIVNFGGSFNLELCRFGHQWSSLLDKAKCGGLVLLLGVGGVIVYLMKRKSGRRRDYADGDDDGNSMFPHNLVKWLVEDELVEDLEGEVNVFGRYFGPTISLETSAGSGDADGEHDSDDLSLNSISSDSSPRRMFLRRPINVIRRKDRTPAKIPNPCPRCVKGTCRLKRHLASRSSSTPSSSSCYSGSPKTSRNLKTSTPDTEDLSLQSSTALGRLSSPPYFFPGASQRQEGDGQAVSVSEEEHSTPSSGTRGHTQHRYRRYRGLPDGQEVWSVSPVSRVSGQTDTPVSRLQSGVSGMSRTGPRSLSPVSVPSSNLSASPPILTREDSVDSIAEPLSTLSVCGSMRDLVTNARDVRRLIRAVSINSQDSEYFIDLDLDEDVGASTAENLDLLTSGVSTLVDNCDYIGEEMESFPKSSTMISSKSSMSGLSFLAESTTEEYDKVLRRQNSIPDLRKLQRASRGQKSLWKLTNFSSLSEKESETGSIEWDSPTHGVGDRVEAAWDQDHSDSVKSSMTNVQDSWEWDYDWNSRQQSLSSIGQLDGGHQLPWAGQELDLESELNRHSFSSSSSVDLVRYPPSGRSDSSSSSSMIGGFPPSKHQLSLDLSTTILKSRSSSTSSSSKHSSILPMPSTYNRAKVTASPSSGEESGFMGSDGLCSSFTSMNSSSNSMFTSSINLSPVKEAREPSSPCSPTVFGDLSGVDTVIKVPLPVHRPRARPDMARGLFGAVGSDESM